MLFFRNVNVLKVDRSEAFFLHNLEGSVCLNAETHIKNVKITRKYFEVMLSIYSYEDLQSLLSFEHQKILRNFC